MRLSRGEHKVETTASDVKISLHRIWWRHGWVLWEGDPLDFEDHRPWTHKHPWATIAVTSVVVAVAVGALIGFALPGYLLAVPLAAGAAFGAMMIAAEAKFASWVRHTAVTEALDDTLRGPKRHHRLFTSQRSDGRDAAAAVAAAPGLVRRYLREHGAFLSRAARRTDQWISARDALQRPPLAGMIDAVTDFRIVSEERGEIGEWEDRFAELNGELSDGHDRHYLDVCASVADAARRTIESLPGAVTAPAAALNTQHSWDQRPVVPARPLETREHDQERQDESDESKDSEEFTRRPQAADAAQIATFYRLHGTERVHDLRLRPGFTALDLLVALPGVIVGAFFYFTGLLNPLVHELHNFPGIGWMFQPDLTKVALALGAVAIYGAAAHAITDSRTGRVIAGGLRDGMGFLGITVFMIGGVIGLVGRVFGMAMENLPL